MRWADTDSDDSDDEFQTHGNVVNTSIIVDLSVSLSVELSISPLITMKC